MQLMFVDHGGGALNFQNTLFMLIFMLFIYFGQFVSNSDSLSER